MFEIGKLCIKTAGRDAGKKAVVVSILDEKYVLIDGETRRRKCNIAHLEPLEGTVDIKKDASHEEISKAFDEIGLKARDVTPKEKKERPKKIKKEKEAAEPKEKKKPAKKSEEKKEVVKTETKKPVKKPKEKKEVKPKTKKEESKKK